jgi:hypothetical protein
MAESDQSVETSQGEEKQPGLKFLEAAVYIMGGLLVLMLVILLGGIGWKLMRRAPAEPPQLQLIDVATPEGASVGGMTLDGDRLAVQVITGAGHEIIVVDTRKGTILSRIRLKPGTAPIQ